MNPLAGGGGLSASSGPAVSGNEASQKTGVNFGGVNVNGTNSMTPIILGVVALIGVLAWSRAK